MLMKVQATDILQTLTKSKEFFEGFNSSTDGCQCEKCIVSRSRHLSNIEIASFEHSYWSFLKFVLKKVEINGLWIEFGVFKGETIKFIANQFPNQIIFGLDSFQGLPEDWILSKETTYKQGKYNLNGVIPTFAQCNIKILKGFFANTLPDLLNTQKEKFGFIHIDCDLYSSTKYILEVLIKNDRITKGTIILFDEFYNYENYEQYEFKAFSEFINKFNVKYEWIAHTASPVWWNGNQVAIRIL